MPDDSAAAFPFPESPLHAAETELERFLYGLTRFGMKPGLRNIRELVRRFDHPERDLRFLHVAGTNGKGSTCLFLESLLRRAGWRTGLFSSPHLLHVGERLRVDGIPAGEAVLGALIERVAPAVRELEATFFETLTLMALLHFRDAGVQWVLWETGLGGRLDSTRVAEAEAALITGISYDHTRYLGHSLAAIAGEKLAIGRRGRPFYCGFQGEQLLGLARDAAERQGFRLRELDALLPHRLEGGELVLTTPPGGRFPLPGLPAVQARNAALALAALGDLENAAPLAGRGGEDAGDQGSRRLLPADIRGAIAATPLPGRYHRLRARPALIVDGAHNPEALAATLAAWDEEVGADAGWILFACMEDKELDRLLPLLSARRRRILFTALRQERALAPEYFLRRREAANMPWESAPDLPSALRRAGEGEPLLITGSFYLAAEAYAVLGVDPWREGKEKGGRAASLEE